MLITKCCCIIIMYGVAMAIILKALRIKLMVRFIQCCHSCLANSLGCYPLLVIVWRYTIFPLKPLFNPYNTYNIYIHTYTQQIRIIYLCRNDVSTIEYCLGHNSAQIRINVFKLLHQLWYRFKMIKFQHGICCMQMLNVCIVWVYVIS